MSYRGGKIPGKQTKQMRKLLSDLDEIAVRGSDTPRKPSSNAGTTTTPGNAQPVQPSVIYNEDNSAGTISTIPRAPAGTIRVTHYPGGPTFKPGGNLKLAGPQFNPDSNEAVVWASDGSSWLEVSRGPGAETFIPFRRYGGVPNIASDMTAKLQNALDTMPGGNVLAFEAGDYIINQANVTRSDISIFLPPGARLYTTAATTRGTLHVAGTINTAASVSVIKNPNANDNEWPRGGERTIYVASGAGAGFSVDSWFSIEDGALTPGGLSADPTYIFEHHMELCRVKLVTPGGSGDRIDLWFPLVNSYNEVGGTPPVLRTVVPVTNFKIWGGGTIENHGPGGGAAHGLVCAYAVGVEISGLRFRDVFDSCIHLLRCQDFRVIDCEMRDPPRFDSRGYGITTYGGIRGVIQGLVTRRLRHCVDVSFFSRQVAVTGCSLVGSTVGNVETHPCVEGLTITGNVIDGGYGQEASAPSFEYGENTAAPIASGIDIDENNKYVSVVGNTVRNMRRAGILVDFGSFSELLTNGALTGAPPAQWSTTGDFALTGNTAVFTFSTGTGTLTQTTGSFAIGGEANFEYILKYTVVANTLTGGTLILTSAFGGTSVTLPATVGAQQVTVRTGSNVGNFVIQLSGVSAGALTLDDFSMRREFSTEFVTIVGNTFVNCGTAQRLNHPPTNYPDIACVQMIEQSLGGNTRRGIVCKSNTLLDPGQYGIVSDISEVIIEGNWIAHPASQVQKSDAVNVGIGIWVRGGATADCLTPMVRNNVIDGAIQNGIRVGRDAAAHNVVGAIVEGNITRNGTGAGIFVEETAPNAIIRNNWSSNNTGVNVDGINTQSDNGIIENNVLVANTAYGIRLIGGADNNILRNNIYSGPGFTANGTGEVLDAGASNFVISTDLTNERIGIGTKSPQQRLQVNADGLRLAFSDGANDYTDIHHIDRTDFYGGLSIQPAVNSSALKWITLFGTAESNALTILDDGTDYWPIRTSASRNVRFEVASGMYYEWNSNFDGLLKLTGPSGVTGAANFFIPSTYKLNDASNNTVLTPLFLQRGVGNPPTGAGVAGIGARISWAANNSAGTAFTMSEFDVVLDVVTAGSEDSSIRFKARDNNALKEIVRIDGSKPGVLISNNATAIPAEMLDVTDDIRSRSLRLDGDTGAGVATTITFCNVDTAVGGATGTATLGLLGNANTPTAVAQSHWLKFYDGTTVRYIPVWT